MSFVSLALLVNGIAGVIGTSLGGIFSDKITSKRWLMISVSIFIVMMLLMNLILPGSGLLLAGLFIWNIMQWSTNPAVQSGVIQHVEGDTSQVMSWNMSEFKRWYWCWRHYWRLGHDTCFCSSYHVYECHHWLIRINRCFHIEK